MLIDSHCHIDFSDFDEDRSAVLQTALDANIKHIIVPAIAADSWARVKNICQASHQLHPAYGLHPYFIDRHELDHIKALDEWLSNEKAIGVGECGLDYYLKNLNKIKQLEIFEAQLELALKHQLPVIIHSRKATEQVIQSIKKYPGLRGMMHSYSGSLEQARQLIDLGFYISFGGAITYENATRLRAVVKQIPLTALLIETDAPDQPGSKYYGERNEPVFILDVVQTLADLKTLPAESIANATSDNASSLFNL